MSNSRIPASVLAISMALFGPAAGTQEATGAPIAVGVDPRIELLSLVFRLAGNPEYNQPNSRSAYSKRVEKHFGELRDHEVVRTAQRLRAKRGVSYDAVMDAGERLFAHCSEVMARQAYGNWKTVMYESLVRASVVRYLRDSQGRRAARQQAAADAGRGFVWVGALAAELGSYEQERERFATLEAFMPRIIAFFTDYAPEYEARVARRPRVVTLVPANGAESVDPALTEIRIVFDRPMRRSSWSICGGGPHFPEITGKIAYAADGCTLRVPVRLKPAWRYAFSLNSSGFQGFQSAAGTPLEPLPVRFATRAE